MDTLVKYEVGSTKYEFCILNSCILNSELILL